MATDVVSNHVVLGLCFPQTARGQADCGKCPVRPSPGAPAAPRLPLEDAYLELLADTLESLEHSARGQFLQRYFRATTHLELRESQCLQLWDEILTRRRELTDTLGRPISLKTLLMNVLSSSGLLRAPALLAYT